ncbi:hypothetical protein AURDEDRAFT_126419 [Auricularia subglabra TFB-10046 SS5]|nr:hypothetical protein AURDEDRAFT_126419 [Auricularia subglabra TFB-10046 SS5]
MGSASSTVREIGPLGWGPGDSTSMPLLAGGAGERASQSYDAMSPGTIQEIRNQITGAPVGDRITAGDDRTRRPDCSLLLPPPRLQKQAAGQYTPAWWCWDGRRGKPLAPPAGDGLWTRGEAGEMVRGHSSRKKMERHTRPPQSPDETASMRAPSLCRPDTGKRGRTHAWMRRLVTRSWQRSFNRNPGPPEQVGQWGDNQEVCGPCAQGRKASTLRSSTMNTRHSRSRRMSNGSPWAGQLPAAVLLRGEAREALLLRMDTPAAWGHAASSRERPHYSSGTQRLRQDGGNTHPWTPKAQLSAEVPPSSRPRNRDARNAHTCSQMAPRRRSLPGPPPDDSENTQSAPPVPHPQPADIRGLIERRGLPAIYAPQPRRAQRPYPLADGAAAPLPAEGPRLAFVCGQLVAQDSHSLDATHTLPPPLRPSRPRNPMLSSADWWEQTLPMPGGRGRPLSGGAPLGEHNAADGRYKMTPPEHRDDRRALIDPTPVPSFRWHQREQPTAPDREHATWLPGHERHTASPLHPPYTANWQGPTPGQDLRREPGARQDSPTPLPRGIDLGAGREHTRNIARLTEAGSEEHNTPPCAEDPTQAAPCVPTKARRARQRTSLSSYSFLCHGGCGQAFLRDISRRTHWRGNPGCGERHDAVIKGMVDEQVYQAVAARTGDMLEKKKKRPRYLHSLRPGQARKADPRQLQPTQTAPDFSSRLDGVGLPEPSVIVGRDAVRASSALPPFSLDEGSTRMTTQVNSKVKAARPPTRSRGPAAEKDSDDNADRREDGWPWTDTQSQIGATVLCSSWRVRRGSTFSGRREKPGRASVAAPLIGVRQATRRSSTMRRVRRHNVPDYRARGQRRIVTPPKYTKWHKGPCGGFWNSESDDTTEKSIERRDTSKAAATMPTGRRVLSGRSAGEAATIHKHQLTAWAGSADADEAPPGTGRHCANIVLQRQPRGMPRAARALYTKRRCPLCRATALYSDNRPVALIQTTRGFLGTQLCRRRAPRRVWNANRRRAAQGSRAAPTILKGEVRKPADTIHTRTLRKPISMSLPAASALSTQTYIALEFTGEDQSALAGGEQEGGKEPPALSPAFSNTTDNGLSPMRPSVVRKEPPSPAGDTTVTVQQWLKKSHQHSGDTNGPMPVEREPPPPLSFGQVKAAPPGHLGPRIPPITTVGAVQHDVFGPKTAQAPGKGSDNGSAKSGTRNGRRSAPAESPSTTFLWSNGHNTVCLQNGVEYPSRSTINTPPPSVPLYATGAKYHGNAEAARAAAQIAGVAPGGTLHQDFGLSSGWTRSDAPAPARTSSRIEFRPGHVEHMRQQYPPGLSIRSGAKGEPSEPALSDIPDGTQEVYGQFCHRADCGTACFGDHGPLRFTPEQMRREAAGVNDDRASERTATSDAGTDDMDLYDDAPSGQGQPFQPSSQPNAGGQLDDDPVDEWSDIGGANLGAQLDDEPQRPPLTDDQRAANAAIAPEFRHSAVAMRATAIVREPIDGRYGHDSRPQHSPGRSNKEAVIRLPDLYGQVPPAWHVPRPWHPRVGPHPPQAHAPAESIRVRPTCRPAAAPAASLPAAEARALVPRRVNVRDPNVLSVSTFLSLLNLPTPDPRNLLP